MVGVMIPLAPVELRMDKPLDTVTAALPDVVEAEGVRVGLFGRP
jgi:hypothetical protein